MKFNPCITKNNSPDTWPQNKYLWITQMLVLRGIEPTSRRAHWLWRGDFYQSTIREVNIVFYHRQPNLN